MKRLADSFKILITLSIWGALGASISGCMGNGIFGDDPAPAGSGNTDKNAVDVEFTEFELVTPSPSTQVSPRVEGKTGGGSRNIRLYSGAGCSGTVIATAIASSDGRFQLTSSALADGTHLLSAAVERQLGAWVCSKRVLEYVLDRVGPLTAISTASVPIVNSSGTAEFTVSFVDASGSNLTPSDVEIHTLGTASCSVQIVPVSVDSARLRLVSCTGEGSAWITIAAGAAWDRAGNSSLISFASAAVAVDNTGPSLVEATPVAGDYSVLPGNFFWKFNETIDAASVATSAFSLSGTCAGPSLSAASALADTAQLTVVGAAGCAFMDTLIVTLDLSRVKDNAGNSGSGTSSRTFRVNNVGPTGATFAPVAGTVSSLPTVVVVTFSSAVDSNTVDVSDFSISGSCVGASVNSVSATSSYATVTLQGVAGCTNGQNLTLGVSLSGIRDGLGNAGVGSANVSWTRDTVGPSTSLSPVSNTYQTLPTAVTAAFDADTAMGSVTAADATISGTCSGVTLGSVGKSGSTAVFNLNGTSGCAHGETVVVTVDLTGVQDQAGNSGIGSRAVTYTVDKIGPTAILSAATGVLSLLPSTITVTLSSDTDMSTVTSADFQLSGTCGGASITGLVKVGNIATLTLSGVGSCTSGQTVALGVALSGITDLFGNNGVGTQTVVLTLDNVGPTAVFDIASGLFSILPVAVAVEFPSDTDMNSVTAARFSVGGTCGTASVGSVVKVGTIATVTLAGTLSCGNATTLVLNVNLSGVQDLVGNVGIGSTSVTYSRDSVGPGATMSLATGSYNPLPTSAVFTFDADTDMTTVTAGIFSLAGSCASQGIASVSKSGQTATVNLSGTTLCLSLTTSILSVNLSTVRDMVGNFGTGSVSRTFTFDNVGPTLSLSIAAGTYKPLPTSIAVTFSPDTDMSTINVSTFLVAGTCLGVTIGSVVKASNVATVTLNGTASCGALSTVIFTGVLTGVKDLVGNFGLGTAVAVYTRGI